MSQNCMKGNNNIGINAERNMEDHMSTLDGIIGLINQGGGGEGGLAPT